MRTPPWSAVAADTAFRLLFIRESQKYPNKKGGSCCYSKAPSAQAILQPQRLPTALELLPDRRMSLRRKAVAAATALQEEPQTAKTAVCVTLYAPPPQRLA
jgi:hypothetical protein